MLMTELKDKTPEQLRALITRQAEMLEIERRKNAMLQQMNSLLSLELEAAQHNAEAILENYCQ